MVGRESAADGIAALLASVANPFKGRSGALGELHTVLDRAPHRLGRPVRLAVVGQIKKGKSTLVNAILGRELAITDVLEATYRVNEFCSSLPEGIEAFYQGGDGVLRIDSHPLSALAALTVRDPRRLDVLSRPDRIVVSINEPLLQEFDLIDTPGLASIYGVDSAETEEVLGAAEARHSLTSQEELKRADAVLYLFDRDFGGADADVVRRFLGRGDGHAAVGPIRALGVMSRCDRYDPGLGAWNLRYNPIEAHARARIRSYLESEPEVGRLFYDIVPVIGLAAVGAQTMPAQCVEWLGELADQPERDLLQQLRYEADFLSTDLEDCPLAVEERRELTARLGQWGVLASCRYLKEGCDEPTVRRRLLEDSGMDGLRRSIMAHFGDRAQLIKLDRLLTDIRQRLWEAQTGCSTADAQALEAVRNVVGRIRDGERGLPELDVRRRLSQDRVQLPDADLGSLYRLTEPLASCARRLILPDDTSAEEMLPRARAEVDRWAQRLNRSGGDSPATHDLVRSVVRIAEDVYDRVRRAADYQKCARELLG